MSFKEKKSGLTAGFLLRSLTSLRDHFCQFFAAKKDVHVAVGYTGKPQAQQTRLIIDGNIRGKTSDSMPIHLLLFGLDNAETWQWEILNSVGLSSIQYDKGEMVNIRAYLYLYAVVTFGILGVFFKAPGWCLGLTFVAKGDSKTFFYNELLCEIVSLFLNIFCYKYWGLDGLGFSFLFIYYYCRDIFF